MRVFTHTTRIAAIAALFSLPMVALSDVPALLERVRAVGPAQVPGAARGVGLGVRVNPAALSSGQIVLSLPGLGDRVASLSRRVERGQGLSWVGTLEGEDGSTVVLTWRRGALAGFVDDGTRIFEFTPGKGGEHYVYELDQAALPPLEPDILPEPEEPGGSSPAGGGTVAAEGANVIDLLVVYSQASRNRYGAAGIESRIISAVEAANQAYLNSQVDQQLNLVYLGETDYTETGDMGVALSALRSPSDGIMDEVHALRDTHGADLVALVNEDPNYCGIGYVMTSESTSFASWAFSVTLSSCLTNQTLAHELGHNQGNMHDRDSSSNAGVFPYSYGYRRCVSGDGFRTVMAYSCTGGTRISYFSNPSVSVNGHPTGIDYETDPASSADAARSMNLTADTLAAFRASVSATPPAAPTALSATAVSHQQIDIGWIDNASDETGFRVERSPDGAAWVEIATLGANVSAWSDDGLMASTNYSYRVRAYNGAGTSSYSSTATATTQAPPPPPVTPSGLAAHAASGSEISLTWNDVDDETGYRLERAAAAAGPWSLRVSLPANTVSFVDGGLSPGETRHYRLAAENDAGVSGFAGPVEATTLAFIEQVAVSQSTTAGTVDGSLASMAVDDGIAQRLTETESGGKPSRRTSLAEHAWAFDVVPGMTMTVSANAWVLGAEDEFEFAWSADGASYQPMFVVGSGDANAVYEFPLPADTSGPVWIRVTDTNRDAGAQVLDTLNVDQLVIRTESDPNARPPAAPAGAGAEAISSARVRVTWTDLSIDESGFRVERSDAGGAWAPLASAGADESSFEDTSVSPNSSYRYRVAAYNGAGRSEWVETGDVTTPDGLSASATGYKVKGAQQVDVSWRGASGSVDILRDDIVVGTASSVGGAGTYTDSVGGKGAAAYTYQVCDTGTSRCSDTAQVIF